MPPAPHPSANPPSSEPREALQASGYLAWRQELRSLGGESAALDWLLAVAAGISSGNLQTLMLHPDRWVELTCTRRDVEHLWQQHLAESVPVQYLMGRCFWRDFELEVGPDVLIPRPETEAMVDLAIELLERGASGLDPHRGIPAQPLWADLGTGSGCLALGLAQALPKSQGLAVDLSREALDQARRNLQKTGLSSRVRLVEGNWFGAVKAWWGHLHLVVANPPYIPTQVMEGLNPLVRDHEPRLALDGGCDGLTAIRSLAQQAPMALARGGWLLLEHHHDQSEQVLELLKRHGLVDGQSHSDLEGHQRFASARLP